jgi:MraZ protein
VSSFVGDQKLFLGKHSSKLDKNNRLSPPPQFRDELSNRIYITQGFDRNLLVLTKAAFQEVYRRVVALNIADPLTRILLRLILGTAHEVHIDKNGYLAIPDDLREFAHLHGNILLVGQGDYFEIWSVDLWSNQEAQLRDADTNSSRFSRISLATR